MKEAFETWRVPLFNYFLRCGLRREMSEDLLQMVFIRLLQNPGGFEPERGGFEHYLFGIARHLRLDAQGHSRPESNLDIQEISPDSRPASPESVIAVRAAVAALPVDQREALVLREFHGFTYEEIAQLQGVPVGTIRSRLARARESLRQDLARRDCS